MQLDAALEHGLASQSLETRCAIEIAIVRPHSTPISIPILVMTVRGERKAVDAFAQDAEQADDITCIVIARPTLGEKKAPLGDADARAT